MSIMNLIAEQPLILVFAVISILLLLFGIGVVVVMALREAAKKRPKRREKPGKGALHDLEMVEEKHIEDGGMLPVLAEGGGQQEQANGFAPVANASGETEGEVAVAVTLPGAEAVETGSKPPEESTEEKPDDAVQDILNSVFVDDESNALMETLLAGTEDIPAEELLTFARQIADGLGVSSTAPQGV